VELSIGSCDSCGAVVMIAVDGHVIADNCDTHCAWHENPGFTAALPRARP